jgi:hypothetical protein
VKLVGTAVVCVLAAFGAAFLVARATEHQSPAPTIPAHSTAAVVVKPTTTTNAELVAQFTPDSTSLKPKPKPKPKPRKRHVAHHAVPQSSPAPTATEPSAPLETTPEYTPAPVAPSPSTPSHSGSSTHHKSSGGSGTTTIGG